ncbi:WD40/YVTN/BNR-like repeat-containing protein [Niabella sp. 22666]|uniref:WD40/YVTN/BNR-like repeat-containing protein n=1 Tax=Niabella sp. 22666 TaxID=3453954 RepID=UPI003F848902
MISKKYLNFISAVLFLIVITGCSKKVDADAPPGRYGSFEIIKGAGQQGILGEFLSDTLTVKVSLKAPFKRYVIKPEILQGNGEVQEQGDLSYIYTPAIGRDDIRKFTWKLGCDQNFQKVKFKIYADTLTGQYASLDAVHVMDSIVVDATGAKPSGWGRACGISYLDFFNAKIISNDQKTLYLISRGIYRSTDSGVNWVKMGAPFWESIVDAQFNSQGWLYLLTYSQGICYSKDLKSWTFINNGLLDHRMPTSFLVEDTAMYVSFYFDGPYRTTNNGDFWRKLFVSNSSQRVHQITRHPNGNLYLADDWHNIFISRDQGNNWSRPLIDYQYRRSQVYSLAIDADGYLYIGAGDATISKLSPNTYSGEVHQFYQMNNSSQHVEDIKAINKVVYFTVNGSPAPGIYSSLNWKRVELGFNQPIYNYYLKSDGTFLIVGQDGIYYSAGPK